MKFNPNEIKTNPLQKHIKNLHIKTGYTKTKKEKQLQLDRKAKQKGWD